MAKTRGVPLELVLGAVGRNVSPLDYHPVWGVDIARFGDDRTALAKRRKLSGPAA
jgi:hypothetical protein